MSLFLLIVLGIAILFSGVINWILIKFSVNLGVRNLSQKEEVRWQKKKPSVGGLSFYLVFLIFFTVVSNLILAESLTNISYDFYRDLSLIVSGSLGFFIGLIDDARNTNPLLKLFGQILCGIVIVSFGCVIPLSPNLIWNGLFTIFWVVFLMNSINMLDNMDGMTSLVSLSILFAIFFSASYEVLTLSAIMILVCAGALIGFLIYNWYPSRIYMGDSGSQFLGVVLAYLSILYLWGHRLPAGGYFQVNQLFLPLMVFTIPIFDTATVTIHRLLRRQSPFVGGKDHLSHHLVFLGLKDYIAVSILGLINLLFIAIGLLGVECFGLSYVSVLVFWVLFFSILQFVYIKAKSRAPTTNSKTTS